MSAKRRSFKVRSGNTHLTIAPWTHPATGKERWRFAYRPTPGAPWKYRLFKTKAEAEAAAEQKLQTIAAGTSALDELTPSRRRWLEEVNRGVPVDDQPKVLDFIQSLRASAETTAAVATFLTGKISKAGEETPHLSRLRGVLEPFAQAFTGRSVAEIHLPDLQSWFATRTADLGWKRRRDIRAAIVQFFLWAQKQGITGNQPVTVAERLPEIGTGERGQRIILTPQQFHQLATHIHEDFRAWIVLGCFAGMRPHEICPSTDKKTAKRGLHCEEIDWKFSCIHLPAEVSKGGKRPRNIPMTDALKAWLHWAEIEPGMTGPVCLTEPAKAGELERLGKLLFQGHWPQDVCRHSYGSYRNAILRNLHQVAEEMGTSETMLHRHYHNPQPEQHGHQWFNLRPGVPICSDETPPAEQLSKSSSA